MVSNFAFEIKLPFKLSFSNSTCGRYNTATMLGVITCDAPVAPDAWRAMLKRAACNSFNQISVDGDTSANDSVIGLA